MSRHAQGWISFGVLIEDAEHLDPRQTRTVQVLPVGDFGDRLIIALRCSVIGGDHPTTFNPAGLALDPRKVATFRRYLAKHFPDAPPPRWRVSGAFD
jgi:hypothetical protein